MKRWWLLLVSVGCTYSYAPHAREIDNIADIQREMRIVSAVFESALQDQLRGAYRVTHVQATYLAKQGVLLDVTLNTPWLRFDEEGSAHLRLHGDFTLPEIPAMVENILHDLELNIAPYEPDALEVLRELREEQRDLRLKARELRRELRSVRREQAATTSSRERATLDRTITDLERELAVVDGQYDQMSAEIETQYKALRTRPTQVQTGTSDQAVDLNLLVATTACDYGATLKSLTDKEYVSVAVRRDKRQQFYAFPMSVIRRCSQREIDAAAALEAAFQY